MQSVEQLDRNRPAININQAIVRPRSGCRVQQCFLDTDLRLGIPGLIQLCEENKINLEERRVGEMIVFINHRRDQIRVLACNGTKSPVMAAYRMPEGRIYDLRVIGEIPRAFRSAGEINFDKALENVLRRHLDKSSKGVRLELEK
jgi:hypothetical protein